MSRLGKLICYKTCDYCGVEVPIYHKERLNHKNIFCSKKCEGEYKKLNNPNYIPCAVCGKLTYKKPRQINSCKTGLMCCSRECMGELRKILYQDENNPNYGNRGINSPLHDKEFILNTQGYVLIPLSEYHPFAINGFWIREHRYIAEKYLMTDEQAIIINGKKYLNPIYDVHHKDKNKTNNSIDNLEIMLRSDHMKLHRSEKSRSTKEK